jgi:hypothetical protein
VQAKLEELREELKRAGPKSQLVSMNLIDGGPENDKAHWYRNEVIQTAQAAQQFANFDQNHYFTQGTIKVGSDRLKFIVSFHHVGVVLNGIMEATAFAKMQFSEDPDETHGTAELYRQCSVEPFAFTYLTKVDDVKSAFQGWLDRSLAIGIKEYGDRL